MIHGPDGVQPVARRLVLEPLPGKSHLLIGNPELIL
jgi:hypothetical protein